MAQTISDGLVPVEMLCPADQPPASWRPGSEVIELYQRSKVIAMNGAGFERWARNAPLPRSRLVNSADAIEGGFIRVLGESHSHGPQGDHAHETIDGHTWLDPINTIAQATAIERAMTTAFPEHAASFAENLAKLDSELRAIHERLDRVDTTTVAVLAPETPYAYLARRYGWPTVRLSANPRDWTREFGETDLTGVLDGRERAVVLCERLPNQEVADTLLASHRVQVLLWETGELAEERTYERVVADNVDRLDAALADNGP